MTTRAQLRKAATALPEVEEVDDAATPCYRVHHRPFAVADGAGLLTLWLGEADRQALVAEHPTARVTAQEDDGSVRVALGLGELNGQQLNHWVRRAWHARAPRGLAAAQAAGEQAVAGGVGDLPKAIGGPATRALATAGITSLAAVARYSRRELLALHGVGPRAVRILEQALAAESLTFAAEE